MSAEVFQFEEFAGSSRGLIARPIIPQNRVMYKTDVQEIEYEVHDLTVPGVPMTGTLDPNNVMFDVEQEWDRDPLGYTFLWAASGTLWPTANRRYRVVVWFTAVPALGSVQFVEAWEVRTKSITG